MKITVNKPEFIDSFIKMRRENNFSYNGLVALYEYLTQYEDDSGEEIELDVIALCCDYSEYKNIEEVKENYSDITDIDDLRDHTTVIEFDNGLIIQNF